MDENKKTRRDDDEAIPAKGRLGAWLKDLAAEFKKIMWPDRKTMWKHAVNVILVSALIGVIIFAMDLVFGTGHEALYSWIRG